MPPRVTPTSLERWTCQGKAKIRMTLHHHKDRRGVGCRWVGGFGGDAGGRAGSGPSACARGLPARAPTQPTAHIGMVISAPVFALTSKRHPLGPPVHCHRGCWTEHATLLAQPAFAAASAACAVEVSHALAGDPNNLTASLRTNSDPPPKTTPCLPSGPPPRRPRRAASPPRRAGSTRTYRRSRSTRECPVRPSHTHTHTTSPLTCGVLHKAFDQLVPLPWVSRPPRSLPPQHRR